MILVIDNYDSFTYNLVQYLGELGAEIRVRRNDQVTIGEIEAMAPEQILISPGPGRPEDAGVSVDVIRRFGPSVPILGVCLGHQAIGVVYGGIVCRASAPMHGKTSIVVHDGKGLFHGITAPFSAGRYHSLVISNERVPDERARRSGYGHAHIHHRHRVLRLRAEGRESLETAVPACAEDLMRPHRMIEVPPVQVRGAADSCHATTTPELLVQLVEFGSASSLEGRHLELSGPGGQALAHAHQYVTGRPQGHATKPPAPAAFQDGRDRERSHKPPQRA